MGRYGRSESLFEKRTQSKRADRGSYPPATSPTARNAELVGKLPKTADCMTQRCHGNVDWIRLRSFWYSFGSTGTMDLRICRVD